MNSRIRSRSRGRPDGEESLDSAKPVVAQQPSDKKPGQESEAGASAVKEPELERESQKMDLGKTPGKRGDGGDVKKKSITILAPAESTQDDGE